MTEMLAYAGGHRQREMPMLGGSQGTWSPHCRLRPAPGVTPLGRP
jgi:hypothetical protein